jgi:hypothetical protein
VVVVISNCSDTESNRPLGEDAAIERGAGAERGIVNYLKNIIVLYNRREITIRRDVQRCPETWAAQDHDMYIKVPNHEIAEY